MIRSFVINNYVGREFFKIVFSMSFGFFSLGFIISLFEEINFFKDWDVAFIIPLQLSLLFVPSMLYKMFPFVILLSGIWFFLKIKKNDEITAMKVSGMSNFSIIIVPSVLSIIIGIIFVTSINPITSALVRKYEKIKGSYYEKEQDYLATVTINGIWIKENNLGKNYIIKAQNLSGQNLINVTVYEFDFNNNFVQRIESESADISELSWILKKNKVIDSRGKIISENIENITYQSQYDIKKIKSIYSNLDTVSFWSIDEEIKLLRERGYSTREMRGKKHSAFAYPFFLLGMVLLSGVFTLGTSFKENNWTYVFISIFLSVLIFYFNDFSAALGKTEKLPIELSVWMPIIIIFIFSTMGMIHANQK